MNVSIIGTNGLLSSAIASYCNTHNLGLYMYGRTTPLHTYTKFYDFDLANDQLNYDQLVGSDLIIYCAGAGIQSRLKEKSDVVYHLNVTVPVQICNSLKLANYEGRFMSFGSYFEIGETSDDKLFSEADLLHSDFAAPNDYTISKRMLSCFFKSFRAPFKFLHFILPTIYGETESTHRLIPYTLKSIEENSDLTFTSGEQIRQYIYINDVVSLLFNTLQADVQSGIYNIAGTEEFTVKELIALLFKLKNKVMPDNVFGKTERADIGMKVLKLNGTKLQTVISYTPVTKISDIYDKYSF